MSRQFVLLLVAVSVGSIVALVSGAPFVEAPLPGGLPLGNALAVCALCPAAAVATGLSRPGTFLRRLSVTSLIAAFAWLPVSVVLAGNLALNFSGTRGLVWVWLSLLTGSAVLCSVVWVSIIALLRHRRRARSSNAA